MISEQQALIGRLEGRVPTEAEAALNHRIFAAIREGTLAALEQAGPPAGIPEADFRRGLQEAAQPWFQWITRYDPAPALQKLRCPTLALFGSLDLQVPPASNAPPLEAAPERDLTVTILPELNHLFQKAQTGSPTEYAKLPKELDPAFVSALTTWTDAHLRPSR